MSRCTEPDTDFIRDFEAISHSAIALKSAFLTHAFREERSRVLAAHGFVRRVRTLVRCVEQIYKLIPINGQRPTQQQIDDATIFLQAFIINIYGSIDNLAWLWVWEAKIEDKGKPLRNMRVGLTPDNTEVRQSLSASMQTYMSGTDDWFEYIKNYRHALAHRIPLYIPPNNLNKDEAAEWRRLEKQSIASMESGDFDAYDRIVFQQSKLGAFKPWMMHSFGPSREDGTPIFFHGQILCDLATVIEIGEKILSELTSLSHSC